MNNTVADKKSFEDFVEVDNSDIFQKAYDLADCLKESPEGLLDGLGYVTGAYAQPEVEIGHGHDKRQVYMLGSNSYLNLNSNPAVVEASKAAIDKYGYGMGAVSLYAGLTELHKKLERQIADFYYAEDAIVFPSGYGTNVGVISALCGKGDIIINDSANHASIFDGASLSGAEIKVFPHGNIKCLKRILEKCDSESRGKFIITDGVFSMHGDMARLDEITELAQEYNCRLMVDDAHGVGVVGPSGRGTAEHYGVMDKVDLNVGMLSKAPAGLGGYCAGKQEVIDYLRIYVRSYFFSTALPGSIVAGLVEVFNLLSEDKAGRAKLLENVHYLKDKLQKAGFEIGESNSGIIPLIIGDDTKLAIFHKQLFADGVYTNIVSYPAVRHKEARVRICMMSSFSKEQLDRAADIIIEAGKKCWVI